MLAEFEEKQYEQHLNNSLLKDKRLLFPPGQVLEGHLGFDAALFTIHPRFWKHFPFHYEEYLWPWRKAPKGTKLPKELWREIEHLLEDLPNFKFNAFIQHKRPEYMAVSRAAEWSSWNAPYYRYKLMPHQQIALSRLEKSISSNGVVVYACPAFHRMEELWRAVEKEEIIDKSNFCQAGRLDNHEMFTFQNPGNSGIAHSEPEKVESYNLLKRLDELGQSEPSQSNTGHLAKLANTINSVMSEAEGIGGIYRKIVHSFMEEDGQIEIKDSMAKIYAFRFLTDTDILIGF